MPGGRSLRENLAVMPFGNVRAYYMRLREMSEGKTLPADSGKVSHLSGIAAFQEPRIDRFPPQSLIRKECQDLSISHLCEGALLQWRL